jgi:hypothetical protein
MSPSTLSTVVGSPRELLEAAVPILERIAEDKRATALEEHDLQEALEQAAGAGSAVIALKHWPEVGPFDIVIDDRIAIELQFCQSGSPVSPGTSRSSPRRAPSARSRRGGSSPPPRAGIGSRAAPVSS